MLLGINYDNWLAYKAEVVTVDPSKTTQICSSCGFIPEKRIGLYVRTYECASCGLIIERPQRRSKYFEIGFGGNPCREGASTCSKQASNFDET